MKLETPRLILRKPKPSDWKDIVEGAGEYDVAKNTKSIPHPYTRADAEWFIKNSLKNWGKTSYTFMVELKAEKKLIGAMGIHHLNLFNGTAGTGSWINKKYWRQGYITEAKIAANDFAFNTLGLRRLSSTVNVNNKASNATQKKVGYVFEGIQRQASKSKASGKIYDLNMYGLLKQDWVQTKKKLVNSIFVLSLISAIIFSSCNVSHKGEPGYGPTTIKLDSAIFKNCPIQLDLPEGWFLKSVTKDYAEISNIKGDGGFVINPVDTNESIKTTDEIKAEIQSYYRDDKPGVIGDLTFKNGVGVKFTTVLVINARTGNIVTEYHFVCTVHAKDRWILVSDIHTEDKDYSFMDVEKAIIESIK